MKKFKWSQWTTVVVAIVLLLSITLTGGSLAYFTDSRETTNIFTTGNVYITLTEAEVKADAAGNLVEDTTKERISGAAIGDTSIVKDYGKIYPGQTVYKDPTITNVGEDEAWIAAKVIISDGSGDIHKIIGYPSAEAIDIERLISGGLLDETVHVGTWNGIDNVCYNDRYAMVQIPSRAQGTYEFYFFMLNAVQHGEEVVLFDTMTIDSEWDNVEMREFVELQIKVQAFAVQTFGFIDCFGSMRAAFAPYFTNCVSNP